MTGQAPSGIAIVSVTVGMAPFLLPAPGRKLNRVPIPTPYEDLLRLVLESGTPKSDRTGTGCGPGVALIFDGMFFNGVLSPSASFTYFGQDIRHTFPTGSFIGEQIVSLITLGGQVGLVSWQGGAAQIYGTGGFALANKILTINFGGPASTQNSWVPGGALGIGFSYAPPGLQIANRQIKLFAQYEHVWLADATFTSPAASPAFNYTFANGLDLVSVGISIALSPGQSGRRALINLGQ